MTSDMIVNTIIEKRMQDSEAEIPYQELVDKIFLVLENKKVFQKSNLTMYEWSMMQKTFKEEKLYYDFIR